MHPKLKALACALLAAARAGPVQGIDQLADLAHDVGHALGRDRGAS